MTLVTGSPHLPIGTRVIGSVHLRTVAGLASVGAGAVHAAAIGAHAEHRQAALVFLVVSSFQLLAGTAVLASASRPMAVAACLANAALVGGWALATQRGVTFIDGLEARESLNLANASAAALACTATTLAIAHLRSRGSAAVSSRRVLMPVAAALVVLAMGVGMDGAAAPSHHAGASGSRGGVHESESAVAAAVVAPTPYDPTKPIDLSGVPGVTAEQQARAENLIAATLSHLPKYADPAAAEAAGYRSINDAVTGYEHYINGDYRGDGHVLDPDRPESLVYQVRAGRKELVAAMYMAEPGTTLDTTPELGGALTQWHIHDNLCFRPDTGAVAGLTDATGACAPPLVKPEPVPMIHVWITPHRCGPFAALDGIAEGSVKPGETKLCDTAHGH